MKLHQHVVATVVIICLFFMGAIHGAMCGTESNNLSSCYINTLTSDQLRICNNCLTNTSIDSTLDTCDGVNAYLVSAKSCNCGSCYDEFEENTWCLAKANGLDCDSSAAAMIMATTKMSSLGIMLILVVAVTFAIEV